jgi:farnesyl-diphosphate farnesyltransferase
MLEESMPNAASTVLLGPLLKSVSRSFYLTLRILPAGMREPIGFAYLLARAADTIADTSLIAPEKRLELLLSLRRQVNGVPDEASLRLIVNEVARQQNDSDERVLLESLGPALTLLSQLNHFDRQAIREIVSTLTEGMEFDLRTFPVESSGRILALQEFSQLDQYTYMVAGCVGEFWTRMTYAYVPGIYMGNPEKMVERGVRLGKALQMTNVLRDCSKDLRIGRCYIPAAMLAQFGLMPQDLLSPDTSLRAQPVLFELVEKTLNHFREGLEYMLALPGLSIRLRSACLWPILIGLETLVRLVSNDQWLDPQKASKISRGNVYRIVFLSMPIIVSNKLVRLWAEGLIEKVEARMRPYKYNKP